MIHAVCARIAGNPRRRRRRHAGGADRHRPRAPPLRRAGLGAHLDVPRRHQRLPGRAAPPRAASRWRPTSRPSNGPMTDLGSTPAVADRLSIDDALARIPEEFRVASCSGTSRAWTTPRSLRCSTSPSAPCARASPAAARPLLGTPRERSRELGGCRPTSKRAPMTDVTPPSGPAGPPAALRDGDELTPRSWPAPTWTASPTPSNALGSRPIPALMALVAELRAVSDAVAAPRAPLTDDQRAAMVAPRWRPCRHPARPRRALGCGRGVARRGASAAFGPARRPWPAVWPRRPRWASSPSCDARGRQRQRQRHGWRSAATAASTPAAGGGAEATTAAPPMPAADHVGGGRGGFEAQAPASEAPAEAAEDTTTAAPR